MTRADLALLRSVPRRRRISLRGRITSTRIKYLKNRLKSLSRSEKPIRVNISSRGGDLPIVLEGYEAILECPATVYGVASRAGSGALILLQACDYRVGRTGSIYQAEYMYTDLPVRVHPQLNTRDLKKFLDESLVPLLRREWEWAHQILGERVMRAGKSEKDLHNLLLDGLLAGKILSADEALKWGFIDEVLSRP